MTTTLPSQAQQDWTPSREAIVDAPMIASTSWGHAGEPPSRRWTQARLQTHFLREFALSGSQADAAARTGIEARSVRRWRRLNPMFARRYAEVLAERVEILEDRAMSRALGPDPRPVFHGGQQVAVVERYNDAMLMRVLARFDRLRKKMGDQHRTPTEEELRKMSDLELVALTGLPVPAGTPPHEAMEAAYRNLLQVMETRISKESASSGQDIAAS